MKTEIKKMALLVVIVFAIIAFAGCGKEMTPYDVADKYLSDVSKCKYENAEKYILPSDREKFKEVADAVESQTAYTMQPWSGAYTPLTFIYNNEECYIDKYVDEDGDYAVAYIKSNVEKIDFKDCKICMKKEDGEWYITLQNFSIFNEEDNSLDSESEPSDGGEINDTKDVEAGYYDLFVKKGDKFTPVDQSYLRYDIRDSEYEFSNDENRMRAKTTLLGKNMYIPKIDKDSELISYKTPYEEGKDSYLYNVQPVKETGMTLNYLFEYDNAFGTTEVYKPNVEEELYKDDYTMEEMTEFNGEELRKNKLPDGFKLIDEVGNDYMYDGELKSVKVGGYTENSYREVKAKKNIDYYTSDWGFSAIGCERTKHDYIKFDLSDLDAGLYIFRYKTETYSSNWDYAIFEIE